MAIYLLLYGREDYAKLMLSHLKSRSLLLLVGMALLKAAAQAQAVVSSGPEVTHATTLEHGDGSETTAAPSSSGVSQYLLGVSDVIRVNVWKSADLSQTVTIGPDGFVSLPLLGDVHAAGVTANQLATTLSSRLSNFVISAQVTVSVIDFRSRQVFVTGQVGKPGAYSLIAPITVLQLIAQAGGLNAFANRKGIFVLRGSKDVEKLKFSYTSAIRGDVKQNIRLQPGDTVIVP